MMKKLKNTVIGGTSVMISIEKRDPIMVYDLNRNRSPNTKPTRPESTSQSQFSADASTGRRAPRLIRVKTLRKTRPITSLIILSDSDPILFAADSNDNAVIVQKKAVRRAANSPG